MGRYTQQVSGLSQHSELWVVRPDTSDPEDGGSMTDLLHDVKIQKTIRIHATVETKKNLTSVLSQCLSFVQNLSIDSLSVYEISQILRHFHSVAIFFFVDFTTRISQTVRGYTGAVCPYQMPKAQRFSTAIAIKRKANTIAMSSFVAFYNNITPTKVAFSSTFHWHASFQDSKASGSSVNPAS